MNFDDVRLAMSEARQKLSMLDSFATELAVMLAGRLRKCNNTTALRAMKRELQEFDSRTGEWK